MAIEFAFLFGIFFFIFYAIVAFGMAFFLKTAFQHAAMEGAREAARLNVAAYPTVAEYEEAARNAVRARVLQSLPPLPTKVKEKVEGLEGIVVTFPVSWIKVRVGYPGYGTDPLIPNLGQLPFMESMDFVPDDLFAESTLRPN